MEDKDNPNKIFYDAVNRSQWMLEKSMIFGIIILIGSITLLVLFHTYIFVGFFFAIGTTFGTIYFIINYRGWLVVRRIRNKKYIHPDDLNELKKISFRGF